MKPYYSHAGIEIYHGDCRVIVPQLQQTFDLLLTDPPYGINAGTGQQARANKRHGRALVESRDYGQNDWDAAPPSPWTIQMLLEFSRWHVIWGGNYFALPPASCVLVWDKDNGENDYADCELAWTNIRKAVRKFRWKWHGMLQENMGADKEHRVHPTQKPLALMKWCISQAPDDVETILDAFAGSCTTARAAKDLGKRCVCIEREERYCEAGAERLRQEVLF